MKETRHSNILSNKTYLLFFCITVSILLFLSFKSEWEFDEAWTYMCNFSWSPYDIIKYENYQMANHHLINSLYFRLVAELGLKNVFFYRMLSLSAFVVYAIYYYKYISIKTAVWETGWAGKVILLLPFILPYVSYFSLGRGYAISVATTVAALYHFTRIIEQYKVKDVVLFSIFSIIASLSIFSFLFPILAMALILVGMKFRDILESCRKVANCLIYAVLIGAFIVLVIYVKDKGSIINSADGNISGGGNLLKNGMLSSFVTFLCMQGHASATSFQIYRLFVIPTLLLSVVFFYRKNKPPVEHAILILATLLMFVAHVFFKSSYPFGRTISYFYFMLYTPMAVKMASDKWFKYAFSAHFIVLLVLWFIRVAFYITPAVGNNTYDALQFAHTKYPNDRIVIECESPAIKVYNKHCFGDKLVVDWFGPEKADTAIPNIQTAGAVLLLEEKDISKLKTPNVSCLYRFRHAYKKFCILKDETAASHQ